ncbi:MAG: hypothetical protein D1H97_21045, partial [Paracoccus sp. BP8]
MRILIWECETQKRIGGETPESTVTIKGQTTLPKSVRQASTLFARLMAESSGYLCRELLVEIVWVLERA